MFTVDAGRGGSLMPKSANEPFSEPFNSSYNFITYFPYINFNITLFYFNETSYPSQDSAVGIVTGYRLDDQEVEIRVPVGSRIFISPLSSRPALGPTQPSLQWVPEALSPGVKRPGHEADNSPPTSAKVNKT
jgi:hypothetical protein